MYQNVKQSQKWLRQKVKSNENGVVKWAELDHWVKSNENGVVKWAELDHCVKNVEKMEMYRISNWLLAERVVKEIHVMKCNVKLYKCISGS